MCEPEIQNEKITFPILLVMKLMFLLNIKYISIILIMQHFTCGLLSFNVGTINQLVYGYFYVA